MDRSRRDARWPGFFCALRLAAYARRIPRAASESGYPKRLRRTGLEITVRPAFGAARSGSPLRVVPGSRVQGDFGSLLDGKEAPYSAGFVGQAMIGYRVHPLASFGLRAGLRNASATGLTDGSSDLVRSSWDAGLYLRAYPLALNERVRKYIDPWASIGVEYMRDMQEFKRDLPLQGGGAVKANWTLDHHAVAIPLGVGIDSACCRCFRWALRSNTRSRTRLPDARAPKPPGFKRLRIVPVRASAKSSFAQTTTGFGPLRST